MVDTKEIMIWIRRAGLTLEGLARAIELDPEALNMKINNVDGEILTVKEAIKIAEVLGIPRDRLENIFFAPGIAKTQKGAAAAFRANKIEAEKEV